MSRPGSARARPGALRTGKGGAAQKSRGFCGDLPRSSRPRGRLNCLKNELRRAFFQAGIDSTGKHDPCPPGFLICRNPKLSLVSAGLASSKLVQGLPAPRVEKTCHWRLKCWFIVAGSGLLGLSPSSRSWQRPATHRLAGTIAITVPTVRRVAHPAAHPAVRRVVRPAVPRVALPAATARAAPRVAAPLRWPRA